MRGLVGVGFVAAVLLQPIEIFAGPQDGRAQTRHISTEAGKEIPVVVGHLPQVGDQLHVNNYSLSFPTISDCQYYLDRNSRGAFLTDGEFDKGKPTGLEQLDRVRVVEVYSPRNVKDRKKFGTYPILVEVETGRMKGHFRVLPESHVQLLTNAGRAEIDK